MRQHTNGPDTYRATLAANGTTVTMVDQPTKEEAAAMHDLAAVRWRRALIVMR